MVVVSPDGELDAMTSPALAEVLDSVLRASGPGGGVVVDFAGVRFCDSRCLGVLVAAYRQARDLGLRLAVAAPRRHVRRLFAISGMDEVLTVEADVARAVSVVRGGPPGAGA